MQFLVFLLQFQMTMMHRRNNKPIVKRWTSFFHFDVSVGVDEWVLGASFSLYITLLNIRIQVTRSNVFRFCFLFLTPAFSSISFFHDLIFCIRYDAKLCYLRIQMWQEHSLDMFTDMELTLYCLVEDQEMAFPGDSQIVLVYYNQPEMKMCKQAGIVISYKSINCSVLFFEEICATRYCYAKIASWL